MRIHVHHHFDCGEVTLMLANARLQAEVDRVLGYLTTLKNDNANLTAQLSTAVAGNATAATAEDEADATDLSTQLDAAGVPALSASVSVAA